MGLVELQEAILATNQPPTWCNHCRKFRHPYCLVSSNFYCSSCAAILSLQPVRKSLKSRPVAPLASRRLKTSLPVERQQKQPTTFVASQILKSLELYGALSSLELKEKIGCSQETIIGASRKLRDAGQIIVSRQKIYPAYLWFALPKDEDQFQKLIPSGLKDKLLKELSSTPLRYLELCKRLPEYSSSSIIQSLANLTDQKLIVRKGYDQYRYYGLPKDAKLVQELSINPKKQKILQFVIANPGLHGREISRQVKIEQTRTRCFLVELEEEKKIKSKWFENKKLFFACG